MFTGIIEELGRVKKIDKLEDAIRLTIKGKKIVDDLKRGDSISVSGACLTAVEITRSTFTADVMFETLKLTSLDGIKEGDKVNVKLVAIDDRGRLQLSMKAAAREQKK